MFKKLFLILTALMLVCGLAACNGDNGGDPSSDPASSVVSITLDADQETAFDDFLSAISVRGSYMDVLIKRDYTEGDVTLNTELSFFQPQGPGYFTFGKVTKKNGEIFLKEHFGGTTNYTYSCGDDFVTIASTGFAGPILERIAYDEVAHTRIKLEGDFDYEELTITAFSHSYADGILKVDITFAEARDGELLKEYGSEGEYYAKDINLKAEINDSETIVLEEITYTLVKVSDGSSVSCKIVTETVPDAVKGVPEAV
ncbi:MAG: hypothetical protein IKA51_03225 [Clostridia bacterium]|nr:hypothetical protein [Clostridia bacterium]